MTRPKQTALQRDVEFVIDSMSVARDGRVWMKRFLRRLVREAVKQVFENWGERNESDKQCAKRIARKLVP